MEKTVNIVEEWLSDCSDSDDTEHLNGCLENDQERLVHAIFTLWDDKTRYPEIYDNTIRQIFLLSKSKDEKLREFVLLFVPSLIYIYLSAISMGDKKSVGSIECALLTLYNKEVLDEQGQPRVSSFRLPTLARQSIYHEPSSLAPASYTTDSLHRLEVGDVDTVRWGPPKPMNSVVAATRYHLVTALFVAFNAKLARLPKIALMHMCKAASRLVCQGFNRPGHHHRASYGSDGSFGVYPRPIPRIPVTSDLLAELTHAIYFAIHNTASDGVTCPALVPFCTGDCYHSPQVRLRRFNEFASLGIQALEDVHMRAQYELYADVLLITNGIKNSLRVNPSGQPSDGPMGISIALTPSTSAAPLSKSYITNASFRTKKLPDDIPIQRAETSQDTFAKGLKSISEETDGGSEKDKGDASTKPIRTSQGSGREKLKLASNIPLPNLVKKKDKEKAKNGDKKDTEKKGEKERRLKEKEISRNSVILSTSESDGVTSIVNATTDSGKSVLPQQLPASIEMKSLNKPSPTLDGGFRESTKLTTSDGSRIEDAMETLTTQTKSQTEVNGSENHVRKVL